MKTVLGVHDGHDAGAALIHGKEIYAVNEERLSREKYHRGFPERSIRELIRVLEIETQNIDKIAVAGIYRKKKRLLKMKHGVKEILGSFEGDIITVRHHRAHAAGAYFTSGWNRCIVLTIDATGDGLSSAVYVGKNGELKKIAESSYLDSVGDFYASITEMLGFVPMRHEGKIMALAGHQRGKNYHDFKDAVETKGLGFENHLETTGSETVKKLSKNIDFPLNRKRECSNVLREDKRDHELWDKAVKTAGSAQNHLEKEINKLCENLKEDEDIEGQKKICYSGGVAQNVKVNRRVKENFDECWVFPHMGDGGLALGSAFKVYSDLKNETKYWDWKESCDNVYLGPKFSSSQIEKVLVEKDDIDFEIIDDKSEIISSLLASGKIVGLFQGRMEYGPRALGNRSIIANPSKMETREKLNKMLGREPFQPFSPTILRKHADDYLEDTTPNKFMTMSFDVTEKAKEQIKAATHIDGTCRPQILERKDNPPFYDIIKCFEKKTDIAAVLNTSFNLHGEPIVCTPKQAVDAFKKIGLDALACGEFLVTKTK